VKEMVNQVDWLLAVARGGLFLPLLQTTNQGPSTDYDTMFVKPGKQFFLCRARCMHLDKFSSKFVDAAAVV
jgi:hypothetical protein